MKRPETFYNVIRIVLGLFTQRTSRAAEKVRQHTKCNQFRWITLYNNNTNFGAVSSFHAGRWKNALARELEIEMFLLLMIINLSQFSFSCFSFTLSEGI